MRKIGKSILRKVMVLSLTLVMALMMSMGVLGDSVSWTFNSGPYRIYGEEAVGTEAKKYSTVTSGEIVYTVTDIVETGWCAFRSTRKNWLGNYVEDGRFTYVTIAANEGQTLTRRVSSTDTGTYVYLLDWYNYNDTYIDMYIDDVTITVAY